MKQKLDNVLHTNSMTWKGRSFVPCLLPSIQALLHFLHWWAHYKQFQSWRGGSEASVHLQALIDTAPRPERHSTSHPYHCSHMIGGCPCWEELYWPTELWWYNDKHMHQETPLRCRAGHNLGGVCGYFDAKVPKVPKVVAKAQWLIE